MCRTPRHYVHREAYRFHKIPFVTVGSGPRACIGEGFAWMEGVLELATIGQRWRMEHLSSHAVVLEPSITLRPKYGMMMVMRRRV